jgi:hypothetical protein
MATIPFTSLKIPTPFVLVLGLVAVGSLLLGIDSMQTSKAAGEKTSLTDADE